MLCVVAVSPLVQRLTDKIPFIGPSPSSQHHLPPSCPFMLCRRPFLSWLRSWLIGPNLTDWRAPANKTTWWTTPDRPVYVTTTIGRGGHCGNEPKRFERKSCRSHITLLAPLSLMRKHHVRSLLSASGHDTSISSQSMPSQSSVMGKTSTYMWRFLYTCLWTIGFPNYVYYNLVLNSPDYKALTSLSTTLWSYSDGYDDHY